MTSLFSELKDERKIGTRKVIGNDMLFTRDLVSLIVLILARWRLGTEQVCQARVFLLKNQRNNKSTFYGFMSKFWLCLIIL